MLKNTQLTNGDKKLNKLFMTTLIASAVAFATPAFAKDTLYIVNSASTGGSFNAAMTAYAQDLEKTYDIEYIQAKGCVKSTQVINKIRSNGGQVVAMFYSGWLGKPECESIKPTAANLLYTNIKAGVIFGRTGENKPFLTDGASVAISQNDSQEKLLKQIASANGISYNIVRYENTKKVVLAMMNGETDFGVVGSPKYFWKNSDKFSGLLNLSADTSSNIPSVTTVGGSSQIMHDMWLYHGDNYDNVRAVMKKIFLNSESVIAKWAAGIKGYDQTWNMSGSEAYNKFVN